ncbi:MAG: DPP IV N-terminal domain-containing protein [Prevotella sp.]|nr:DPP IV N-terminal domain-containing protein [Prevotella sp.]
MRRYIVITLSLLLALTAVAGKRLTLTDVTGGALRAEGMRAVTAMPDGETYAQISDDGRRIVLYSFKTGREVGVLFDAATVKGSTIGTVEGYQLSADGRRLLIETDVKRIYRRSYTASYYLYDVRNNRATPLSDGGPQQAPLFSPDGLQVAFVRANNIYIVKLLYDNAEVQVTKDGEANAVINGIPDWVNEEEFGVERAMVFTADSRQLVWVRYDERHVKEYSMPLFKGLRPERSEFADYPGFYTYKYPIAGGQNAAVSVWSYDIESRRTRQLEVPMDADGYIPRIVATDDASRVAVCTLNRHQDCLRVYMVNPLSTVSKLAVEDRSDKYIREEAVSGLRISGQHILLPSDRDGNMHLYLYNLNGQLLRQIERGDYEVSAVYGYDEKSGNAYYASHENGATDQRVWVARKDGRRECLTPKAGWSTAVFSSNWQYFIHTWSNLDTPFVYTVCNHSGKPLATLVDNQALRDALKEYDMGERSLFCFTTSEGVTLNGWLVKPAGFDASKRYPVVMYQYGGPGSQQVKDAWSNGMCGQGALLEQYLCQQGFVCVCVDNRGTGGRGAEFEKCTYRQLGVLEARDQVEAALWLGSLPYVDKERIGIWGWSYGGFNTLMSMSEGRAVFRAGIAIAPPTSWRYYDTIYTERFMRTPQENPTGYDDCPIARVGSLHGALLLCHGMADDNVHYRNTAEYTEALVQADKDFRQLVYTNRNHSIYGGNTRNHLFRQCCDFFEKELKN